MVSKGLIDLKITPADRKKRQETMKDAPEAPRDEYPYGLELTFDQDQIERIPFLQNVSADQMVSLEAVAKVTLVESTDQVSGDGTPQKRKRVRIQIQKIEIDNEANEQAAFDEEDGKEN